MAVKRGGGDNHIPGNEEATVIGGQKSATVSRRGGLSALAGPFGGPMSRTGASKGVTEFADAFKALLEKEVESKELGFKVTILDSSISNAALSAIIITLLRSQGGKECVTAHTMLVENSGKLMPRTVTVGQKQFEFAVTAGDVADNSLMAEVKQAVTDLFGGRNVQVVDAGASVIPTELSIDDEQHVRNVLYGATVACWTTMVSLGFIDEPPFTAEWVEDGNRLQSTIHFNPADPAETLAGLPVRNDIEVVLQGSVSSQSNGQMERAIDITKVTGYTDIIYTPPQSAQQHSFFNQNQPVQIEPYFTPVFVMTSLATEISAATMELHLAGIASTLVLLNGTGAGVPPWMNGFRQNYRIKANEVDVRDIGAIGYFMNLTGDPNAKPTPVATKLDSFGTRGLYSLLHAALHPGLVFAMDVEEVSDTSWINLAFIAAAGGNREAIALINGAADTLTLGNFSKIWDASQPIAYDTQNRIHTGYYFDDAGVKRDLRDLDQLAMANLVGGSDRDAAILWGDSFSRTDIPGVERLERREQMIRTRFQSVKFKGYARRINFNPNWLAALGEACAAAGLRIQPNNPTQEFGDAGRHGDPNAMQYAMQGVNSNLFSFTGNQRTFGASFSQPSFGGSYRRPGGGL